MVIEKVKYWVPPLVGIGLEAVAEGWVENRGADWIAKNIHRYVSPPKNLGEWQRANAFGKQRTANTIKAIGKVGGVVGVAFFIFESYECVKKCVNETIKKPCK